jgi:hypothetical protein
MKHVLVLQWLGSNPADVEELLRMEHELERLLGANATVDGHDFGSGQMNIFIETDQPADLVVDVQRILGHWPRWSRVRAAHREATGDQYTVVWPPGQTGFTVK